MSARAKTNKSKEPQAANNRPLEPSGGNKPAALHPALDLAWRHIEKGNYTAAADVLHAAGYDVRIRNALGVCLMRSGQTQAAVDVFRAFVLMPGSVMERQEISSACKRNFATALLMKGFPSGALSVLAETHEADHPMAVRLFAAIKQWENTLPWYRWLDWKINHIEPSACHVPLDFEPGEFEFEVVKRQPDKPTKDAWKLAV